jgi:hypothetical protein
VNPASIHLGLARSMLRVQDHVEMKVFIICGRLRPCGSDPTQKLIVNLVTPKVSFPGVVQLKKKCTTPWQKREHHYRVASPQVRNRDAGTIISIRVAPGAGLQLDPRSGRVLNSLG